jgi:hypothetical protein
VYARPDSPVTVDAFLMIAKLAHTIETLWLLVGRLRSNDEKMMVVRCVVEYLIKMLTLNLNTFLIAASRCQEDARRIPCYRTPAFFVEMQTKLSFLVLG